MSKNRHNKKPKEWKRTHVYNRHHIINKCKGGPATLENLLTMDIRRHEAWHLLFQNLSFEEVIELLQRVLHAKEAQRFSHFS